MTKKDWPTAEELRDVAEAFDIGGWSYICNCISAVMRDGDLRERFTNLLRAVEPDFDFALNTTDMPYDPPRAHLAKVLYLLLLAEAIEQGDLP